MGKVTNYVCDAPNCKAVRGETNHWFFFEEKGEWVSFTDLENHSTLLDEEVGYAKRGCVCSRGCAQKVFETFLSNSLSKLNKLDEITT